MRALQWPITLFAVAMALQVPQAHAQITSFLDKPNRMLVGLGAGNSMTTMQSQGIKPDIIDTYLVGVGSGQWPSWNSPSGSYVTNTAKQVESMGAVPMFTLYQMASNGDGNISEIGTSSFMTSYWSQAKLMFQMIGSFGKPTLVNLEPDFWGYVEGKAPNGDPTQLYAYVSGQPECASLPNTAAGIAQCLIALRNTYAPNAKIGFPPSFWGENATAVGTFMVKLGAEQADFIVAQTSDRDAGCMEVSSPPAECAGRGAGPFYWDVTNQATPNFNQNLSLYQTVSSMENNLPILYWQTPMGVPSTTKGGTNQHYRDDHVSYMLSHGSQYAAANVFAIVFSSGAGSQTTISTDGGQFQKAISSYLQNPAPLSGPASGLANGTYKILNKYSGLALEDYNFKVATTSKPATVDQRAYSAGSDQKWTITSLGNGQYSIVNLSANQPLTVAASGGSGAHVELYPSNGGSNQIWTITAAGGGYYKISPSYNGNIVLDDFNMSKANGNTIGVWKSNGGANQEWLLTSP
jgi:hypothetical protein